MRENSEDTERLISTQNKEQEEDFSKENQQLYKVKICTEVIYDPMLNQTKEKCSCFINPIYLLIYSIIIEILVVAGLYFRISNNEGYIAYKEYIEKEINILEMGTHFPNENETLKLLAFLKRDKNEDSFCTYLKYSFNKCLEESYRQYCNITKYNEKKCNYMDRQYFLGYEFICNEVNFKKGLCDEIQYNDYLYTLNPYEKKIEVSYGNESNAEVNITSSFILEKFWCNIGNYDSKIYLSFLFFLGIFILFLIYSIIMVKKNLQPGINYYIIITCYMFYCMLFRIYMIIFWMLFLYSIIVTFYQIRVYGFVGILEFLNDPFFNRSLEIGFPEQQLWKDKRINAIIFCGITLALSILVIFLSKLKNIINNYLSFNFNGKNLNKEVIRKASIKVGNNKYKFELVQNSTLNLSENGKNKSYFFMETVFENNRYYLKCNNLYLKDQLNWALTTNPENNILYMKLSGELNLLLYNLILLIFSHFLLKADNNTEYYQHLLDLGYEPKLNILVRICFYLNSILFNLISYPSIIIVILVIISFYIRAIFGGFGNTIILWLKICFAFIISIVIFALILVNAAGAGLNETFFWIYAMNEEVILINSLLMYKFNILSILLFFSTIYIIFIFIAWIKIIPLLKKIRSEKSKLSTSKNKLEDEIMYTSTVNTNYILEAV